MSMDERTSLRSRARHRLEQRYLELLCSVYLYNEHRGYRGLDRVLDGVRQMASRGTLPEGEAFIARVAKHRADERRHYVMFRRWFERRGVMPFDVGHAGHIDGIIQVFFGRAIDDLEPTPFVDDEARFAQLCRAIALTERRGMAQVRQFQSEPVVQADGHLMKIFKVVERDEPSHWEPYEDWLAARGRPRSRWRERVGDTAAHVVLVAGKFPFMLFNPWLPRRADWPDDGEAETSPRRDGAAQPHAG